MPNHKAVTGVAGQDVLFLEASLPWPRFLDKVHESLSQVTEQARGDCCADRPQNKGNPAALPFGNGNSNTSCCTEVLATLTCFLLSAHRGSIQENRSIILAEELTNTLYFSRKEKPQSL